MPVSKVREVMQLLGSQQHRSRQTVHWRIPPPLIVKPTIFIQKAEEIPVQRRAKEVHIRNFEVAPEVAHIPCIPFPITITQQRKKVAERPRHGRSCHHRGPERSRGISQAGFVLGQLAEQRCCCLAVLPERDCVAVCFALFGHFDKRIVGDCAGEGYVGFDAPVPFVRLEGGVIVEESMEWLDRMEGYGGLVGCLP